MMRVSALLPVFALLLLALAGCLGGDEGPETDPQSDPSESAVSEGVPWYLNATVAEGGSTFEDAVELEPLGLYEGNLTSGEHYYKFPLEAGDPVNIELREVLQGGGIPAPDNGLRMSFQLLSPQGVLLETPVTNQGDTRLMMSAVPVTGDYRFLVSEPEGGFTGKYTFCFLATPDKEHPCPDIGHRPQEIIYGGSLGSAHTDVLLFPPPHGDLTNPNGPTALDYIDAAVDGIREWVDVLHAFGEEYPEYDYLKELTVDIQIFDGVQDTAEYDIVIGYIPSGGGAQFRGVASPCANPPRCILLTLFSASPRAGQTLPDFPTYNDMEAVTKHEFAHVWGLGHTLTWTEEHGPDLMNSPATFVYGDGDPLGDGGVRTPKQCISTLNLYGMALIFGFLDDGNENKELTNWYDLPEDIPYEWYCGDDEGQERPGKSAVRVDWGDIVRNGDSVL